MRSDSLEDGRPRPSREPDATTAAVHCSRRHGSFRRAVRGRRKFPLCSSVPSVVTHQHRGHRGIPSGRTGLAPITSSSAQPSAQKPKSAPAPPHSIRAPLPDGASRAFCSAHTGILRRLFPKPSPRLHKPAPAHQLCNTSV